MVFAKYQYPLPNNGTGYSFTEQELIKLLDSVYEQGYAHGVESTIKPETVTATYGNLTVTLPIKDSDHMWNNNNEYDYKMETVNQAIDEIKLLENVIETEKYSDSVYNNFRKEVCDNCPCTECMQSKMDIVECPMFDNYLFDI